MRNKPLLFIFFIFALAIFAKPVKAVVFDPNNIISDSEMLDYTTMSLPEIDAFLKSKGGFIAFNSFEDAFGVRRTAAEIIYRAATNNYECESIENYRAWSDAQKQKYCQPVRINPKVLLVLLQKEQSLLDDPSPSQKRLDWATGYGICDSCSMDDPSLQRFKGFGKQINSAALQFHDYVVNPSNYGYKKGQTYLITNTGRPSQYVTPQNHATAGLYNYTPHVYNGNFNFFKLYLRYFSRSYPNGTLLQAKGENGVWLIQDGKRRPFQSKGALTSRFDQEKIITVNASDLDAFPIGSAIKYPQYSLVRSPRGTVFLLIDDKRRGFASAEALRKVGVNPEEIVDASWDDINSYQESAPITATTSHPTGALLQDKKTGGIFFVTDGTKAPLWDKVLLKTKFKGKSITPESPEKLASYKTVEPAIFGDSELLKSDKSPAVYVIDSGARRPFSSGEIFEELGYKWKNVITVPDKIMALYPEGQAIVKLFSEPEITIEGELASSSPEIASSSDEAAGPSNGNINEEIENILNP
jgi:hypothetical protein